MRLFNLILTAILTLSSSCSGDQESVVPSVPVNIRVNLDDPTYTQLNAISGSIEIDGGVRGIIIYHKSSEEYMAYDKTCSYNSESPNAIVSVHNSVSSSTASDSTCGSGFQLTDGSPIAGPASQPLRSYQTQLVGRELFITN